MNWDKLLRDFRENRCVLLLGPRLAAYGNNGQTVSLTDRLTLSLADHLQSLAIPFDPAERSNLAYIAQRYARNNRDLVDLWDKVTDFYAKETRFLPSIYQKLARLPVSIAVNSLPDQQLVRAWGEQEKQPWFRHYNFRRNRPFDLSPDRIGPHKPLLYNLFGTVQDKESLVLTQSDQLDFVRRVLEKNPQVPDDLVAQFSPFSTYLFVGFDLEDWSLRLLIDSLQLCRNISFSPQADNYGLTASTRAFYEEKFNFYFFDRKIEDFIDEVLNGLGSGEATGEKKVALLAAPEDESFLAGLERAFSLAEQNREFVLYHRNRLMPGDVADEVFRRQLDGADAILLLVSSDFFANRHLMEKDLAWAKEKNRADPNVPVVPVVIRPCDWMSDRELRKITPLPEDGYPVDRSPSRDEAYQRILAQLKKRLS